MAPNQIESQTVPAREPSRLAATSDESNFELSENAPPKGESVVSTRNDQPSCALRDADPIAGRTGDEAGSGARSSRSFKGGRIRAIQRELPLLSDPSSISHLPSSAPSGAADWFLARDIARALGAGWHKKKVHRAALAENWPVRRHKNRLEYQPPRAIARIVLAAPDAPTLHAPHAHTVRFCDLTNTEQRLLVTWRRDAVLMLNANRSNLGIEVALQLVSNHFKSDAFLDAAKTLLGREPKFDISPRTLRRWSDRFALRGIDGLVEQKKGRSGRKPHVADLDSDQLLKCAAAAIEHGSARNTDPGRRINIARSYRETIVADPTLTGPAREWAHGDTASKSHVPDSVRDAIKQIATPLAVRYAQVGPKAAKLDGPYTECHYDNLKPGQAFTADDMTANAYVWVEWENEAGFLLIRPQVLAAMDIATMYWLNVRVVIRPKGQYNKDDVWGLIGDVLDEYGKFEIAVLEGGTWQSDVVRGVRTDITDAERFGGLTSIGTRVIHTRTPRGKIIETGFNQLQFQADAVKGYCGRMEMKDCPEHTKAALAAVRSGKAHPLEHFLHLSEYTAHLKAAMSNLNHERGDGKLLRGQTPVDKWLDAGIDFAARMVPDKFKHLYRSAYNASKVTRNGFTVRVGTGRNMLSYTWELSAEMANIWRGRRVIGFWNDSNPDTDAVIYSIRNGKPHQFLCLAKRVRTLPRFGATEEQSAAEARRKKLLHQQARTQSASLAPFLRRGGTRSTASPKNPSPAHAHDGLDLGMAARIKRAREASERKLAEQRKIDRTLRDVELTDADREALEGATGRDAFHSVPSQSLTDSEIDNLLSSEPNSPDPRLADHEYASNPTTQHSPADTQDSEEPF